MNKSKIYHLKFNVSREGKSHFFFGSLAAIFDMFSPADLGTNLSALWRHKMSPERPYVSPTCIIEETVLYRKSHKAKKV